MSRSVFLLPFIALSVLAHANSGDAWSPVAATMQSWFSGSVGESFGMFALAYGAVIGITSSRKKRKRGQVWGPIVFMHMVLLASLFFVPRMVDAVFTATL